MVDRPFRRPAFRISLLGTLERATIPPQNIRIADFNADGRADIAGLDSKTGDWLVSQSDGATFTTSIWGSFGPGVDWRHILAADFSGHGRTDVAAWNPTTGDLQLGQSNGKHFDCHTAGKWPIDADWQYVATGHFNDDRRQGIVGLDKKSGRLAIAALEGAQFTTHQFPSHPALDDGIQVGAFNGDARDNLAGWTKSGEIWLGILDGNSIRFEKWGAWPNAEHLADTRTMNFWPQRTRRARSKRFDRLLLATSSPLSLPVN